MTFHLPSFLLGVATGVVGRNLWERFQPALAELSAAGSELGESMWHRLAVWEEDAEDAVAAARKTPRRRTAPRRRAARARVSRSRA